MNSKQSGRRRFLKEGAALAGLAVGAMRSASGQTLGSEIPEVHPKDLHVYGERSRFVNLARAIPPHSGGFTPRANYNLRAPLRDTLARISHQRIAKGCHFWHKAF